MAEESLCKRMQKFRERHGEHACPWPAYWIADAGALEGEIMTLKAEVKRLGKLLDVRENEYDEREQDV
jgi:hypothetical protein